MAYLAVNCDGSERMFKDKPRRVHSTEWYDFDYTHDRKIHSKESVFRYNEGIELPNGTIERLIGHSLSWDDECVKYGDEPHIKVPRFNHKKLVEGMKLITEDGRSAEILRFSVHISGATCMVTRVDGVSDCVYFDMKGRQLPPYKFAYDLCIGIN